MEIYENLSIDKPANRWTYESCYELAKTCASKSEMKSKNHRAYIVALRNGWFDYYYWFIPTKELLHRERPNRIKWDYKTCYKIASQYDKLSEFAKNNPSVYTICNRKGWIEYYTWFELSKNKKKYNYQYTYDLALQFNKLSDFIKQYGRAYSVARKNGWIKDYTWLEKKDISPKPVQQCDLSGNIIQIFVGAREASRVTGYNSSGIIECCNGKMKQYKGYIWRYKDE